MTCRKKSGCSTLSRRDVLGTAIGAAAVAVTGVSSANAVEEIEGHYNHKFKMTQESVHYYDKGVPGSQICAGCHYYIDPTECIVVEGYVSPYGWCDYYND